MNAATKQILLEEGYRSTEDVLRGWALLTAMSRVEQYRAECEALQKKHGISLAGFERAAHAIKGQEDFAVEDAIDDWEFAAEALMWWQSKVEELRVAASA